MALINQIKEMQSQGISDDEIIEHLQSQGNAPMEIRQAIDQANIKSAVGDNSDNYTNAGMSEMQPSLMDSQPEMPEVPQPQQTDTGGYAYPSVQDYSQQQYPAYQQQEYPQYQASSSETITEIAESIAEEKIENFRKKLGNIQDFRIEVGRKVESMDDRLRKIEEIIQKLQATILARVGSYGDNIEEIKDEMKMMQDSFSKALNPLMERAKGKRGETHQEREEAGEKKGEEAGEEKHHHHVKEHSGKKKHSGIEHFLKR